MYIYVINTVIFSVRIIPSVPRLIPVYPRLVQRFTEDFSSFFVVPLRQVFI